MSTLNSMGQMNKPAISRSDKKQQEPEEKQEHVGVHTTVRLRGFNGDEAIHAKVDTGAETSSLHAGDLKVSTDHSTGDSVASFTFGSNRYQIPVISFQSVSSADGGTKHRPVVQFTVYIADQVVPNVEFNLNDRSQMEFELLVGLNLIQAAKLKVDPSLKEMELNFSAPVEGGESSEDTAATEPVDKPSVESDDDQSDEEFLQWYRLNKDKTVAELFAQLITRTTDDAS